MKMSRVSKVLLALAILGFLISFPALAQETKKPTIPWTGKLRDGREITKDDLAQIIYQRYRWIESKGKEGRLTDLRQANLKEAYLLAAWLNNINLYYANLSEANLFKAHLYGAILTETDLSGANLIEADLRGAKLFGTNLKGAEIGSADLSEAWF